MAEPVTEAEIDRAMTVLRTYGVPASVLAADLSGQPAGGQQDREILRRILAAGRSAREKAAP